VNEVLVIKEQIRASGVVAQADEYLCRCCRRCAEVCEFGAIEFVKVGEDPPYGPHSGSLGWPEVGFSRYSLAVPKELHAGDPVASRKAA
jgi:ferredoxin